MNTSPITNFNNEKQFDIVEISKRNNSQFKESDINIVKELYEKLLLKKSVKKLQIDKNIRSNSSKNNRSKYAETLKLEKKSSLNVKENNSSLNLEDNLTSTSMFFKSFDDRGRKINNILNQTSIIKPQSQSKSRNTSNPHETNSVTKSSVMPGDSSSLRESFLKQIQTKKLDKTRVISIRKKEVPYPNEEKHFQIPIITNQSFPHNLVSDFIPESNETEISFDKNEDESLKKSIQNNARLSYYNISVSNNDKSAGIKNISLNNYANQKNKSRNKIHNGMAKTDRYLSTKNDLNCSAEKMKISQMNTKKSPVKYNSHHNTLREKIIDDKTERKNSMTQRDKKTPLLKSNSPKIPDLCEKFLPSASKLFHKSDSPKNKIDFSTFLKKSPAIQPLIKTQFTFKPSILRPIEESELDAYLTTVRSSTSRENSKAAFSMNNTNFFSPRDVPTSRMSKSSDKKTHSISNNNSLIIGAWASPKDDKERIDGKFLNRLKNLTNINISKENSSVSPSRILEEKSKKHKETQSLSFNNNSNTFTNLDKILGVFKKNKENLTAIDNNIDDDKSLFIIEDNQGASGGPNTPSTGYSVQRVNPIIGKNNN